jgi:hypothetical protein
MPLSKITLLQIGDIHLPDWKSQATEVDVKLSTFSPTIISSLATKPLTSVLAALRSVCRDVEPIDAVITMGDFTSRGDTAVIADAVMILEGIINDSLADRRIPVFGVPGNHDVSRDDALQLGDTGKFGALQEAFRASNWRDPPVRNFVSYEITGHNGVKLPTVMMNSSIGSWSKALFPRGLMDSLLNPVDGPPLELSDREPFGDRGLLTDSPSDLATQIYEQIDTPYFRAIDLEEIASRIGRERKTTLVVSHHNILPQYIPRISYFGEVLNAGYARRLLLQTNANILYLHGHIHDDPIEIIRQPSSPDTQVISVSAPEIWKGFNKISIFFTDERRPFLIKITQYRIGKDGMLELGEGAHPILLPLMNSPGELLKKDVYRFWSYMENELHKRHGEVFNWEELNEHAEAAGIQAGVVEPVILALYCSGMIHISNFSDSFATWRIEIKR